jgi:hypothetical protein
MTSLLTRATTRAALRRSLGAALLAALAACGGGDDGDASRATAQGGIGGSGRNGTSGTLAVALAATPACGFDAVNVTVSRLRFTMNAAAGDGGPVWFDVPLPFPRKINLLTLSTAAPLSMGAYPASSGVYTQLRVVLAPDDAAHPLANSVVPTGGVETPLVTPGAQQAGIKIDAAMAVPAGGLGSYVIDLDACRSVTGGGPSGPYVLDPVIQVLPAAGAAASSDGRR